MNETERKRPERRWVIGVILYAVIFFLVVAVSNLEAINSFLSRLLGVLAPVLLGLAIAYLINPLFRLLERRVFHRLHSAWLRRTLSLLLTYAVAFALICGLVLLIVPQLVDSIRVFAANFNSQLDSLIQSLNGLIEGLNELLPAGSDGTSAIPPLDRDTLLAKVNELWESLLRLLRESVTSGNISHIISFLSQTASVVTDVILAVFISLYLLATKELRYAQVKKLRTAWIPERIDAILSKALAIADRSFGGFLRGKILDSTIIGILVYLFCLIVRIPNPLLIAVIIGITDIIPVIGPFIGVIPSAVIILLTDPIKVIFFLLAILVIQQIDGNIIAPKILGENTGVSSLCVMIAIILMGALWGLVGMLVGVPLFATVLELLKIWIRNRLAQKGLPDEMESYYARDSFSETPDSAKGSRKKRGVRARPEADASASGTLAPLDRLRLGTYALALRHGVFADPTDSALEAFAADGRLLLQKMTEADAPPEPQPEDTAADTTADVTQESEATQAEHTADATAENAKRAEKDEAETKEDDAT